MAKIAVYLGRNYHRGAYFVKTKKFKEIKRINCIFRNFTLKKT
jgi:hypothetical protein